MLMVALSFIGIQKFVFLLHDYGKLPLDHWYCNSRFSFVAVILHGLILILSLPFFLRKILFSRQPIYMYVERHVDIYFLATNIICSLSTLNKIKLPTTIDSVLFVTLV